MVKANVFERKAKSTGSFGREKLNGFVMGGK